jgi:uncharacterized protein (TIGR00369 family)
MPSLRRRAASPAWRLLSQCTNEGLPVFTAFAITSGERAFMMVSEMLLDDDFEERVRSSFVRQKAMATIGAELTKVTRGVVEIEMPFAPELTQQHGFLHAGVISTALDSACGYAAFSMMPPDAAVLTIEFKVNLLAPGKGERFLFRGAVTKPGRTIIVADGQAYAFDAGGEAKMIATMTGTMMTVTGRQGIDG